VVGPGGHGKSSLVDFLCNHTFQKGRPATEGVAVTRWDIAGFVRDGDLRLNVWDFGGQEIQHSTHEFFLTERAVYLLVFCPRDDQAAAQGLYYWLDLIHLVTMQAPVIVALSKQDEHEAYVNDAGDLKRLHENIVDFIPVSCDVNHRYAANVQHLSDVVQETVSRELRHVSYKLPAAWMEIKAALECGSNDYLSYVAYQTLCATKSVIDPEDQKLLADFLHDLGTMLNYSNRLPLEETHILNPAWVTQGVYAVVLAPELRDTGGVLDERLLFSLLNHQVFGPFSATRSALYSPDDAEL
jgi:internalin A